MLIMHQAPVLNYVKYNGNKVKSFKNKSTLFQSTTSQSWHIFMCWKQWFLLSLFYTLEIHKTRMSDFGYALLVCFGSSSNKYKANKNTSGIVTGGMELKIKFDGGRHHPISSWYKLINIGNIYFQWIFTPFRPSVKPYPLFFN